MELRKVNSDTRILPNPSLDLHTGYYAQIGNYNRLNYSLIGISRYIPRSATEMGYRIIHFVQAAPSEEILFGYKDNIINEDEYVNLYLDQLEKSKVILLKDLDALVNANPRSIFLCYEKPDKFCHRHVFSEWISEHGYNCSEFGFPMHL